MGSVAIGPDGVDRFVLYSSLKVSENFLRDSKSLLKPVIPAKAGISLILSFGLDPRLRGDDGFS